MTSAPTPGSRSEISDFKSRVFWPILVLILALAAGVRFYQLGTDDYWLDELHSFANSAGKRAHFEDFVYGEIFLESESSTALDDGSTAAAVWRGMRDDSHPPLYFLLLLYWRRLVGDGEFAARSLSAAFSVLSIVPVAVLLKRAGRPRAGLVAALVLALGFSSIFVAQQDRQYSLAMLLLGCSFLSLHELQTASTPARRSRLTLLALIYGATLYLCMMSHYFCGLVLMGHVLYAAFYFRGRVLRYWLAATIGAAALFAITWGSSLAAQLDFIRDQPWLDESGPGHLSKTFLRLTDLPGRLLVYIEPFRYSWNRSLGAALVVLGMAGICLRSRRNPATNRSAILFALWFACPAAALLLLDLATDKQLLNHLRYPVIAVPGLAGLIGLVIAQLQPRVQLWPSITLAVAMALFLKLPATDNPKARAAVSVVESVARPDDLLIFNAIDWPRDWVQQFYAPMRYYMRSGSNPRLLLRENPSEETREAIRKFDRIIVISPLVDEIPNPAPDTHAMISRSPYFWQVGWVYVFERQG